MALATPADFEICGLRKEVLSPRKRVIASVDPVTDRLAVQAHGWSGPEPLQFEVVAVPGVTPALPAGLSASIVYYPLPVFGSDTLFAVSTTVGGAAVNVTDAGAGTFMVRQGLGPTIARTLELISAYVEDAMPADLQQTDAAVWIVCKLAAFDLAIVQGLMNPDRWQEGKETIGAQAKTAEARLDEWRRRGAPPRKPATDGADALQNGTFVDVAPLTDGLYLDAYGEERIS